MPESRELSQEWPPEMCPSMILASDGFNGYPLDGSGTFSDAETDANGAGSSRVWVRIVERYLLPSLLTSICLRVSPYKNRCNSLVFNLEDRRKASHFHGVAMSSCFTSVMQIYYLPTYPPIGYHDNSCQ